MIEYTSPHPREAIKMFLDEFIPDLRSGKLELASRHTDELVPEYPADKSEQVQLAIDLYSELIRQYKDHSTDFMAVLVIGTDHEDTIVKHSLQELTDGKLELYPPPELYLIRRTEEKDEPFITEEYRLPVSQDLVRPQYGSVYAYYKTLRNEQEGDFLGGFCFEHYPIQGIEHDWA